MRKFAFILIAVFLLVPITNAETIDKGHCIRAVDGDTLIVKIKGKKERVCLIGVDTPETKYPRKPIQYFGKEASKFTKKAIAGKKVLLKYDWQKRDKYKRLLAYVYRADDNFFLNLEIIEHGYGHAYTRFPFKYLEEFRKAEKQAREDGKGLWSPTPQSAKETSGQVTNNKSPPKEITVYITKTGSKYHRGRCRYLRKSKYPISLQKAKEQGYLPCKVCRPNN